MSGKELLTADETAELLKVTKRTILRWAREGKIESIKISRKRLLFSQESIEDFLKSKTNEVKSIQRKSDRQGRWMSAPIPKKGGGRRTSGESWRDLRQEVSSWES
jgi:excisionase family DNA binding protein